MNKSLVLVVAITLLNCSFASALGLGDRSCKEFVQEIEQLKAKAGGDPELFKDGMDIINAAVYQWTSGYITGQFVANPHRSQAYLSNIEIALDSKNVISKCQEMPEKDVEAAVLAILRR